MRVFGIRARLLTPMAFHGLAVDGGSASIPDVLGDTAMAFALANALGWMPAGVALPSAASYRHHLAQMPYRLSLLTPDPEAPSPRLGNPSARKLNIDIEGGRLSSLQGVAASGNIKDYFTVQEVLPGASYVGLGVVPDADWQPPTSLVVRTGLGQQAQVHLELGCAPACLPARASLNAHTAALFGRRLGCENYLLHTLQATALMPVDQAILELAAWR